MGICPRSWKPALLPVTWHHPTSPGCPQLQQTPSDKHARGCQGPCRAVPCLPSRERRRGWGETQPGARQELCSSRLAPQRLCWGWGTPAFPQSLAGVLVPRCHQQQQRALEPSASTGGSGDPLVPPPGVGTEVQTAHVARGTAWNLPENKALTFPRQQHAATAGCSHRRSCQESPGGTEGTHGVRGARGSAAPSATTGRSPAAPR